MDSFAPIRTALIGMLLPVASGVNAINKIKHIGELQCFVCQLLSNVRPNRASSAYVVIFHSTY